MRALSWPVLAGVLLSGCAPEAGPQDLVEDFAGRAVYDDATGRVKATWVPPEFGPPERAELVFVLDLNAPDITDPGQELPEVPGRQVLPMRSEDFSFFVEAAAHWMDPEERQLSAEADDGEVRTWSIP